MISFRLFAQQDGKLGGQVVMFKTALDESTRQVLPVQPRQDSPYPTELLHAVQEFVRPTPWEIGES